MPGRFVLVKFIDYEDRAFMTPRWGGFARNRLWKKKEQKAIA